MRTPALLTRTHPLRPMLPSVGRILLLDEPENEDVGELVCVITECSHGRPAFFDGASL